MSETSKLAKIVDAVRSDGVAWVTGWWNRSTGQGSDRDKGANTWWLGGIPTTIETLDSLFSFNDLAHAICIALPEWGMRHGWDLTLEAKDAEGEEIPYRAARSGAVEAQQIESGVRRYLDRIDAHDHQRAAAIWGQAMGGGLILIGADDGRATSEPLDEDNIQSIEWLRPVPGRREVIVQDFDRDVMSGRLGQPVLYRVQELHPGFATEPQFWHHTRVIRYPGVHTPPRQKAHLRGWDLSVLDRVVVPLALYDALWAQVGAAMADGSQGVWKIKGLFNAILTGKREELDARMEIADQARSLFRSIMIDSEDEDFTYVSRNFGGIAEIMAQAAIRIAAAAERPVTVLFGQSPSGMNATGESDIRLWYDRVESYQTTVLRPRLERLVELVTRAHDGPTNGVPLAKWKITYRPVRKATPMEEAELRARQAQVDVAYIGAKVLAPAEVAVSRFTTEGHSGETQINIAARIEAMPAQLEALKLPPIEKAADPTGAGNTEGARQLPPPNGATP